MKTKNISLKKIHAYSLIAGMLPLFMIVGCAQNTRASEEHRGLDSVLTDTSAIVTEAINASANESIELHNALFAINPEDYIDERNDIWDRVRSGFQLQDNIDHPRLMSELNWYSQHGQYLDRVVERAEPFLHYIMSEAEARGLPTELALLPIVESAFQPFAYSHGRAAGIWQFIPSTGKIYGLKQNWWYDGRRDVYASTQAALKYLENLHREFNGDWLHALAAYNSGSGTVQRAIRKNISRNKPTDFWSLDLPKETQAYVPKLLALKRLVDAPHEFDLSLRCVEDLPYFERVDVGSQIDLAMAADMADMDLETLYELNPGFNRWATDPYGPHSLLIPVDNAPLFKEALAELAPEDRIKWKRHKIAQGETLSHIADRYTVSVDNIKQLNNLRSNSIRVGDHLVIPVASRKLSDYNLTAYQRKRTLQSIERKGTRVMHYVQSGETFWEISRKYKVNHRELARWNGMAPRDPLKIGQKLVVWTRKPVSSASAMASVTGKAIQSISYRVRNGDSLYGIAQRFRVAVNDLKRWNVLDGKYLQPGQMLKLYVDITEQTSEG